MFPDMQFAKDYSWQERAVEKLMEGLPVFYSTERGKFERAFVVEVSPSGGKTVFSLKAARALIEAGLIDKVFAVVPRDTIKDGFGEDCRKVEMRPEFRLLMDRTIRIETDLLTNYTGTLRNYHGAAIKRFKNGSGRWIVAKDMISEGTSLPRLRTLLIFRDIKSEVRFQQLVHRITRNRSDLCAQDAKVIYFCLPAMRRFAQAIEDSIRLVQIPEKPRCPNCDEELEFRPRRGKPCTFCGYEPPPGDGPTKRMFEFEGVEFSGAEHVDQGGDDYSPFDPISRVVITRLPHAIGGRNGINEILRIAHDGDMIDLATEQKEEPVFSVEERVKRHWDIGYDLCRSIAGYHQKHHGRDFQTAIIEIVGACKRAAGFGQKKWQTVLRDFPDPIATMQKFEKIARREYEAVKQRRAS